VSSTNIYFCVWRERPQQNLENINFIKDGDMEYNVELKNSHNYNNMVAMHNG